VVSSSQRPLPTQQTQERNIHVLSRIRTRDIRRPEAAASWTVRPPGSAQIYCRHPHFACTHSVVTVPRSAYLLLQNACKQVMMLFCLTRQSVVFSVPWFMYIWGNHCYGGDGMSLISEIQNRFSIYRFRNCVKARSQTCEKRLLVSSYAYVCPTTWNKSAPTGWIFFKCCIWVFFENLSRKFTFH
jgi:hypothetical protein